MAFVDEEARSAIATGAERRFVNFWKCVRVLVEGRDRDLLNLSKKGDSQQEMVKNARLSLHSLGKQAGSDNIRRDTIRRENCPPHKDFLDS